MYIIRIYLLISGMILEGCLTIFGVFFLGTRVKGRVYVSASEILGPIDEMTSLSKMTSK